MLYNGSENCIVHQLVPYMQFNFIEKYVKCLFFFQNSKCELLFCEATIYYEELDLSIFLIFFAQIWVRLIAPPPPGLPRSLGYATDILVILFFFILNKGLKF
jgi:hypothetical protein